MHPSIHQKLILGTLALSGKPVARRLKFAREFQYQNAKIIKRYQYQQLQYLLKSFSDCTKLRLYNKPSLTKIGSLRDLLDHLPLMDKQDLNVIYQDLKENNFPTGRDIVKRTSGSSGKPSVLVKNNYGLACELAATWRSYEWAGVQLGDKSVRVWGRSFSRWQRIKQSAPDFILNRQRLSAFNLNDTAIDKQLKRIAKQGLAYIYGYTSIIRELAQARQADISPAPLPKLKAIITTAEPLDAYSRRIIEDGFGVRCYNEYGCTEVGSIAHECEHGALHIMADNLIVETVNTTGASVTDVQGEIVITDLTNQSMPIIRYRVGDFGVLSSTPCPCGRQLPVISSINGRVIDLIQTPDGRLHNAGAVIYIVDLLNAKTDNIKQYQAVQETPRHFTLHLIPKENKDINILMLKTDFEHLLRKHLHSELCAEIKLVNHINREQSGKYRAVKRIFPVSTSM